MRERGEKKKGEKEEEKKKGEREEILKEVKLKEGQKVERGTKN